MDNISLEKIDTLKSRANVTYNEAKDALEKSNGDIVEALLMLEKEGKIRKTKLSDNKVVKKAENIISRLNKIKFQIYKKETMYLNVPSTLAIILALFTLPISIFLLLICVVLGFKIRFESQNKNLVEINNNISKFSDEIVNIKDKINDTIK